MLIIIGIEIKKDKAVKVVHFFDRITDQNIKDVIIQVKTENDNYKFCYAGPANMDVPT